MAEVRKTDPRRSDRAKVVTRLTATARLLARDAFLVLATLAIALKIMIPVGFMPDMGQRNGLPFAMVLCTGDGAKVVLSTKALDTQTPDDQGRKSPHDAPCSFAAQGANAPAPMTMGVDAAQVAVHVSPDTRSMRDTSPGRGLAAPPPPSTGPPIAQA